MSLSGLTAGVFDTLRIGGQDITALISSGGQDVYTKNETDSLLNSKANGSTVTTLATTVSSKANSTDVYTKTQTDNLLNDKANSSTVTTLSTTVSSKANATDVYTQSAVNNLLNSYALTSALSAYVTSSALSASYLTATEVHTAVSSAVSSLVGSAPATLDTIQELSTALSNSPDTITNLATLVGQKASQSDLTALQNTVNGKQNALSNASAGTAALLVGSTLKRLNPGTNVSFQTNSNRIIINSNFGASQAVSAIEAASLTLTNALACQQAIAAGSSLSNSGSARLTISSEAAQDSAVFSHSSVGGTAHTSDAGYFCSSGGYLIARSKGGYSFEVANSSQGTLCTFRSTLTDHIKPFQCASTVSAQLARIGMANSNAAFWHTSLTPSANTVALSQSSAGATTVNSASGSPLLLQIAGTTVVTVEHNYVAAEKQLTVFDDLFVASPSTRQPTVLITASTGSLSANTKNFRIPHPTKEGKYLQHCCVEAPEPGNLYRMTCEPTEAGTSTWELAEWYEKINKNAQVFVQADRHWGRGFAEVTGSAVDLTVDKAGTYHLLILTSRADAGVAGWELEPDVL